MSDTIATDLVTAANEIGQLLRRDGDVAEQEWRITRPPRDALAEDGFLRLLTAPLLKDVPARATPAYVPLPSSATTAGVAERVPVSLGQRQLRPRRRDARLSVIGVDRVRVVDASIMPALLCANPNLTGIMLAEHTADRR